MTNFPKSSDKKKKHTTFEKIFKLKALSNLFKYDDQEKENSFVEFQKNNEMEQFKYFIKFFKYNSIFTIFFFIPIKMIITNTKQFSKENIIFSFIIIFMYMLACFVILPTIHSKIENYALTTKLIIYRASVFFITVVVSIIGFELLFFRTKIFYAIIPDNKFSLYWLCNYCLVNYLPTLFFLRNVSFQLFTIIVLYFYLSMKFCFEEFKDVSNCLENILYGIFMSGLIVILLNSMQMLFRENFESFELCKKKNNEWKKIFKALPLTVLIVSEEKEIEYSSNKLGDYIRDKFDCNWKYYEDFKIFLSNSKNVNKNNDDEEIDLDMILDKKFIENSQSINTDNRNLIKLNVHPKNDSEINLEIKILEIDYEMKNSFLFLIDDVSEKNLIFNMKKNEEFKNKLISSFSHELKTPINGSNIPVQKCLDDPNVSEEIKQEYIMPIKNNLTFLEIVTNDMIDYGAISTNQLQLFNSKIKVTEYGKELFEIVQPIAKVKNLNLMLKNEILEDMEILNDKNRIMQVSINLLRNAVKFTNTGDITIRISKENIQNEIFYDYPRVKIEVIDTGVGMSIDQQEKLKESMFHHHLSHTSQINLAGGGGLGLTISQNIVQYIGPEIGIQFTSEHNRGSTFFFYLDDKKIENNFENSISIDLSVKSERLFDEDSDNNLGEYLSGILPVAGKKKERLDYIKIKCNCPQILIVDDESFNIFALEMVLKPFNLVIEKAFNGKEALKAVQNCYSKNCHLFKLILMDIQMPEMNGIETTKEIKKLQKQLKKGDIPIIACTAFNAKKDYEDCMSAGMVGFFNKPISKEKISDAIRKYIKH